jgi:hypothetical protein
MVEEIEMQNVRCGVAEVKSRRAVVEVKAQYAEAEAERVLVSDRSEAEVRAIASAAVQEGYVEYTSSGERLGGNMLGTKMGGERGKGQSERGVVVKECIVAAATSKELLTVIPVLFFVVLSLLVHLVFCTLCIRLLGAMPSMVSLLAALQSVHYSVRARFWVLATSRKKMRKRWTPLYQSLPACGQGTPRSGLVVRSQFAQKSH